MDAAIKKLIISALNNYRGDDYERAKAAFSNCTPAQMQQVWSGNGETRQQILDGYERHVKKVEKAIAQLNVL